ncbi:MAG TPA: polyphosphate kinase 2 family protein [Fibrobacteria bacterium]|nr:polyphosphate kinase 2 family protein [Fibrobacteria bacterium]HOX50110.1 polyphosphate kinase 2 family protein [Fibrobacteria bacterium]
MKTKVIVCEPGKKVRLDRIPTDAEGSSEAKEQGIARTEELRPKLRSLQERFYAEGRRGLVVVFQAMDTGGKDGAVRNLFTGVDPAGVDVTGFKSPTSAELAHDYLWRLHQRVPSRGKIGVWNRSHYEDILAVRVRRLVPDEVWKRRFGHVNDFERMLTDEGFVVVKYFLHISRDTQKKRLEERLADPSKHWKFDPSDLEDRELWSEYHDAYEDVFEKCSTAWAPWRIVPADRKWARNLALMEDMVSILEELDPRPPASKFDLSKITIR